MQARQPLMLLLLAALAMAGSIGLARSPTEPAMHGNGGFTKPADAIISVDPPARLRACTIAAAETYLRQWSHPYADPSAPPATIAAILAANGICSVTLRGTFVVSGPPTPAQNTTLVGDTGHLLFDAQTGALLTVGVGGLERVTR